MLNDAGSDALAVFDTDLLALAIPSDYGGFGLNVPVATAAGTAMRQQIVVELQLLDTQGNPVSEWILENGIVLLGNIGVCRLSGDGLKK